MDSEFNPWTAPSAETSASGNVDSDILIRLPIEFRPSVVVRLFMLPIGILLAAMTISICFVTFTFLLEEMPAVMYLGPLSVAFITGLAAYGCLLSLRCKISLTETSIQKTEFFREVINYSQIESWHYHPATGTVNVVLQGDTDYVAISNSAMSREKSKILGKVLLEKIGPPRGQDQTGHSRPEF